MLRCTECNLGATPRSDAFCVQIFSVSVPRSACPTFVLELARCILPVECCVVDTVVGPRPISSSTSTLGKLGAVPPEVHLMKVNTKSLCTTRTLLNASQDLHAWSSFPEPRGHAPTIRRTILLFRMKTGNDYVLLGTCVNDAHRERRVGLYHGVHRNVRSRQCDGCCHVTVEGIRVPKDAFDPQFITGSGFHREMISLACFLDTVPMVMHIWLSKTL